MNKKYALITVSDKSGVGDFARELEKLGYFILSTSNTAKHLRRFCNDVTEVSQLTGFPEILDGRVKTLHPTIHAGILADRSNEQHLSTLQELGIDGIDIVVVNLYPFSETRRRQNAMEEEIIENIDIGGPSLIRAAAKNFRNVLVLTSVDDYATVVGLLQEGQAISLDLRKELAGKAFSLVADYDTDIAEYFGMSASSNQQDSGLPAQYTYRGSLNSVLRYGENPHQQGGFYTSSAINWKVLHGKELSFNNYLDIDSSMRALRLFDEPTVVITKHCNPCGIGSSTVLSDAYRKALAADTISPFGGIVALNRILDMETAELINQIFTEIIIAPGYAEGVLDFLRKKRDRRLIEFDGSLLTQTDSPWELKKLLQGSLLQQWDLINVNTGDWKVVTERAPETSELRALIFGWKVVALLRSNAIALTTQDRILGLGSGQTSRIDSSFLALWKARKFGHDLSTAICASDGFFPFRDSVDEMHQNGIKAIIQPGGSKADAEIVKACNEHAMAMVFTGVRHFRH